MTSKPTVTVFADASLDPATGAAGWGCWIKADGARSVTRGGEFREKMRNIVQAEVCAIANALRIAQVMGVLSGHVMIQSDSAVALGCIRQRCGAADSPVQGGVRVHPRRQKPHPYYSQAIDLIAEMLKGVKVTVRHVRGHQQGVGRTWVNNECDRLAKRGMRRARASQRLEELRV